MYVHLSVHCAGASLCLWRYSHLLHPALVNEPGLGQPPPPAPAPAATLPLPGTYLQNEYLDKTLHQAIVMAAVAGYLLSANLAGIPAWCR